MSLVALLYLPATCSSRTVVAPANGQMQKIEFPGKSDELHYICNEGYVLHGSPARLCVDGLWNGSRPECVGKN